VRSPGRKARGDTQEYERQTQEYERQARELALAPRVINPRQYLDTLQEWNASGPGCVLLFNIELQSFRTKELMDQTWGKVAAMTNVKRVVLVLPEDRVRHWERIVFQQSCQQGGFFEDPARWKFHVCESKALSDAVLTSQEGRVAFAAYRKGEDPSAGEIHQKVVVFVLSEPFSTSRGGGEDERPAWWDYHHILTFVNDPQITSSVQQMWRSSYNAEAARDVKRVLDDVKPLQQWEPSQFLEAIGMPPGRRDELLPHLEPRRVTGVDPPVIPLNVPGGEFRIEYETRKGDTDKIVNGRYSGVDHIGRNPRLCAVWVGGFTEAQGNRLPELFERYLKKEDIVQLSYTVSAEPRWVTLSRYEQDMREVLSYANRQVNAIIPNRLVLIARSINGLIASIVGAETQQLDMLAGVVLVAPVFDIVEMMDNYRARHGDRPVRVEKLWRRQPDYSNAAQWEAPDPLHPDRGWLHFFGHDVSLALLADIFRQSDRDRYRLKTLVRSIGEITQRRRYVYVLSNPDVPITGSARALRELHNARGGAIDPVYYRHIPIQSSHEAEVTTSAYPFVIREELQKTREALHDALKSIGLPT
jgi:hypothetical protein